MAIEKCVQCHAPLQFADDADVTLCHFCGTQNRIQTPQPIIILSPPIQPIVEETKKIEIVSDSDDHVFSQEQFSQKENQPSHTKRKHTSFSLLLYSFMIISILFYVIIKKSSHQKNSILIPPSTSPFMDKTIQLTSSSFCLVDANHDSIKDFALEGTIPGQYKTNIFILDGKTGKVLHSFLKEGNSSFHCADQHSIILLHNTQFSFSVYDVQTGKFRFIQEVSDIPIQHQMGPDCVFIQTKDEKTFGFSIDTGQKQTCVPFPKKEHSEEAIEKPSLTFGKTQVQIEVKHPGTPIIILKGLQDEKILWQTKLPILGTEDGLIYHQFRYKNLLLLIGHQEGEHHSLSLVAVDGTTGQIKYQTSFADFSDELFNSINVFPKSLSFSFGYLEKIFLQDSYLYLIYNHHLRALDPETGQDIWSAQAEDSSMPTGNL